MKPKKILYIITKSNWGGAQRYVHELATFLPQERYQIAVACGGNGLLAQKLAEQGLTVFAVKNFERDIDFIKEVKAGYELFHIIQEFKPDIVHLNSSKAGGVGALVSRLVGVKKIIFTAHGWAFNEPKNIIWRSIVWFFSYVTALLVHQVITVSHYDTEHCVLPLLRHKISYIPNGLPYIAFKTKQNAREFFREKTGLLEADCHKNVLWIGTIAEYVKNKNLLLAIQSVKKLIDSGVQCYYFIIGAEGDEKESLEKFIEANKLTAHVFLIGFLYDARTYLKAFDVFVLPSLKEGLPYALLEAGQAGIASIASNVGGIPEIVEDGISGLLINPRSEDELFTALTSLQQTENLRQEYGQALNDRILTKFGGSSGTLPMINKTLEVYEA